MKPGIALLGASSISMVAATPLPAAANPTYFFTL
jgi:hypothetical protein